MTEPIRKKLRFCFYKGKAICKKCGKVMPNVQKGHADYCYDCEDLKC